MSLLSQIVVGICFIILIVILFFDSNDYLTYSVLLMLIAAVISAIDIPEARNLETYIKAIEWEVIIFLIAMFTIVEILIEARIFHKIAKSIVNRYKNNIRKMFYVICIVSTLLASILEDLSVAIIFIPIIVLACSEIKINPSPFLLGMTICINLASTLTPFGSAENIMIANYFDLSFTFFLLNFGPFFVVSTLLTLVLLDYCVLSKEIKKEWHSACESEAVSNSDEIRNEKEMLKDIQLDKTTLIKNFVALGIFVLLLIFIDEIHVAGLIGLLVFVFVNPKTGESKKKQPRLSYFLSKVDYKLIYFFMCLFIMVELMVLNGTVEILEEMIENLSFNNIFLLSVFILIITSLLSGFLDNAPVTIIFLPVINILKDTGLFEFLPLLIAFVLGVNLGGNFLPQGSAADMMTLELSKKYCVEDLTYKKLTKVGGLFALIHILLGIIYLAIIVFLIL
ncbi:SLC13 family permease [Promethearchaeum syntrophicum]|uniref:SLC13 family permease n=1 Tax=Promethearchaeum syntrophicum TaxID=2594042 RepID=A0A5B9D7H6_9ARCH|nr:SLC13 family permease [Candidatus Prometheoarchaeum syntrophicum]QEE15138.1 Citrate transporter [Candidatus Prometheoarchaeum syntrophicum]